MKTIIRHVARDVLALGTALFAGCASQAVPPDDRVTVVPPWVVDAAPAPDGAAAALTPDEVALAKEYGDTFDRTRELLHRITGDEQGVLVQDLSTPAEAAAQADRETRVPQLREQLVWATAGALRLGQLANDRSVLARRSGTHRSVSDFGVGLRILEEPLRAATQRVSMLSNHYGLYAGTAYSMQADGSWTSGVEALLRFENQASNVPWVCPRPSFVWCRRFTEITYQPIGALDVPEADTSGSGGGLPGAPGTPSAGEATGNPFLQRGSYFRMNTGAKWHVFDWIGVAAGVGLSSVQDTTLSDLELVPRGFLGASAMTMYWDGALSQLIVGGAYDKFWRREVSTDPSDPLAPTRTEKDYGRIIVDGLFMIPGLEAKGFSFVGRLYADAPIDGSGPSELRASLLLYQPFSDWQKLFNPLKALELQKTAEALLITP